MKIQVITWTYKGPVRGVGHSAMKIRADNHKDLKVHLKWLEEARKNAGAKAVEASRQAIKHASSTTPESQEIKNKAKELNTEFESLRDQAAKVTGELKALQEDVYISWWPADPVGFQVNKDVPRHPSRTYKEEKKAESRSADHKTQIPVAGQDGCLVGLDGNGILKWWARFAPAHPDYNALSLNCAIVVALALEAGGADLIVPRPKGWAYLDPNMVRDWAEQVKTNIEKANVILKGLESKLAIKALEPSADWSRTSIMSSAAWRSATAVRFGRRLERWSAIDGLLDRYEVARRKKDRSGMWAGLIDLIDAIKTIVLQVPDTSRLGAVRDLYLEVRQAMTALTDKATV